MSEGWNEKINSDELLDEQEMDNSLSNNYLNVQKIIEFVLGSRV
ncbi:hypothetical protein QE390_003695 [Siphonobacter sp. SORGH_AS 1065]|nr:hypothetical protein [Siphonobacter sp. SORGH_AS_1065]